MIWFGIFFALALTAAVYRASLRATATAFAAALFFYALFGGSFAIFLLLVLLWCLVFVPTQMLPLRQEWISRPLLDRLSMVASAGVSTGCGRQAAALARGLPDWSYALSASLPSLRVDEQAFLDGPVEEFCRGLPRSDALGAAAVPAEYGGLGFSRFGQQAVIEKIASVPGRRFADAAQALAGAYRAAALLEAGASGTQKQGALGLMARGAWVAVLDEAQRAPGDRHGTDRATARHGLWKGREQDGFVLDFAKSVVAGLGTARAVLVALLDDADSPVWAWVPTDTPGLSGDRRSARGLFVPRDFVFHVSGRSEPAGFQETSAARACALAETAALRAKLGEAHDTGVLAQRAADAYVREARRLCADDLLVSLDVRCTAAVPALNALALASCEPQPARALARFDGALLDYAGAAAQMLARSLLLGLSGGRLLNPPALGALRGLHGRVSRASANLGLLLMAVPWCGARSRHVEAVLNGVWQHLCDAAAVLRVYELQGRREPDTPFARVALTRALRAGEQALDEALHALPSRLASRLLRIAVFPLGRSAGLPKPEWEASLVSRLQDVDATPLCTLRFMASTLERLRETVVLQRACARAESQLDDARLKQPRVLDRVHEALGLGLLSPDEAARVRELHNRRVEILSGASQQTTAPAVNLIEETDYEK